MPSAHSRDWHIWSQSYPGRVDVAIHVEPVPGQTAAPLLRKQRARLESTRRIDADSGRLTDPGLEAATTDAAELAERVARGAAKLFRTGIYLTVTVQLGQPRVRLNQLDLPTDPHRTGVG